MTSRLSTDTLNQMTPLLGSLARLIAGGVSPTEAQLQTLLLGADLEDEPGALEELKRWQRLLTVLQQQPTRENRQATVEALRLRGLPEAPVLLAVDLVMGSAPASSPAPPSLTASVERLDLGVLPPGQGATAELEVQGGPGQIVAESDLVWVTPQHFGPGPTRIRVEVRPMQSGVLWTKIRLVTAGETIEVPLVAQWQEEPSPGPKVPEWAELAGPLHQRRLPVYFLIDTSANMAGAPIESVRMGLEMFRREILDDPLARDVVKVGIITFSDQAQMLTPGLVPVEHFEVPELVLSPKEAARLDLAFELLQESFDRDVIRPVRGGTKGDWRPVVFVLINIEPTDEESKPSDEWKTKWDVLIHRPSGQVKPASIIVIGLGPDADAKTLRAISTGPSCMVNAALSFTAFFKLVS